MSLIEVNWRPERRQLWWFGLTCTAVFGGLGIWAFFGRALLFWDLSPQAATIAAAGLWGLSALSAALTTVAPKGLLPLYVALTAAALPIGWVISHVLLAIVWYALITPVGLLRRLMGADPMAIRFDANADSYWQPLKPVDEPERYFRQF